VSTLKGPLHPLDSWAFCLPQGLAQQHSFDRKPTSKPSYGYHSHWSGVKPNGALLT
jgi:hypothetical protein